MELLDHHRRCQFFLHSSIVIVRSEEEDEGEIKSGKRVCVCVRCMRGSC